MTHPLTDESCCQLWQDNKDNWLKLQEPFPATRRIMRAAYDKGRDDTLSKVIAWIFDNLEDPRLLDDIYLVVDGEDDDLLVCINTDQIVDDLYEVIHPQENN